MNYFIITRFNLKLWKKDKHNRPTQSEEWLEKRFKLFEKYCFPSIVGQSCKDFIWICLFDKDTPEKYKDKIKNYSLLLPAFHPCFLDEKEAAELSNYIKKIVTSYLEPKDKLIFTTRLDNDDALHIDYVKTVRDLSSSQHDDKVMYSFKYGIQYYEAYNLAIRIPYENNHFLTLIEQRKDEQFDMVLNYNHFYIEKMNMAFKCFDDLKDRPMWVEVIHGSNVDNDCKMTLSQRHITKRTFMIDNFGLNISLSNIGSHFKMLFCFCPRFFSQVGRRIKNKISQRSSLKFFVKA